MNYAYEIRRQAEAAPRAALPAVSAALWKAFGEGHLSEAEAEALSALVNLGYRRAEVQAVVARVLERAGGTASTASLISASLRELDR